MAAAVSVSAIIVYVFPIEKQIPRFARRDKLESFRPSMSNPIRLMHFADTHFGVETYGRLDSSTGLNTRLQDFRDSLCRCIDDALGRGVQLALFAGDAYKSRDPSQTQQREFALCIRKLTAAGIPVVMLTGNHDIPSVK